MNKEIRTEKWMGYFKDFSGVVERKIRKRIRRTGSGLEQREIGKKKGEEKLGSLKRDKVEGGNGR